MTYIPTWAGFIYLAAVIDAWSRRVVGWALGERMTADLVLAALNMALEQRRPDTVIHHSDQGCQPGFNRSSQHGFVRSSLAPHLEPRLAYASRGSCEAGC